MNKLLASNIQPPTKVLFTLAGGGYLWEAKQLINQLSANIEYFYVTGKDSIPPSFEEIPKGEIYYVSSVTTLSEKSTVLKVLKFIKCFLQSTMIIKKTNPELIICVGTSVSIPICIAAKLLRKKTIFIESITRVNELSKTGRIISRLKISDHLFVQWPEMSSEQGTTYSGSLL